MTRNEALVTINSRLASLDDARVQTVAEFVRAIAANGDAIRRLTARELGLLEQSRADFGAGRTLSVAEARARTGAQRAVQNGQTASGANARTVRLSITFNSQLNELLDQGEQRFGTGFAEQKKPIVYTIIEQFLARHAKATPSGESHDFCLYRISRTPFVVLYDFDDNELRVHFIFHRRADLRDVDPETVEW